MYLGLSVTVSMATVDNIKCVISEPVYRFVSHVTFSCLYAETSKQGTNMSYP